MSTQPTFTAYAIVNGVRYTATSVKSYSDALRLLQQQIAKVAK